MREAEGKKSSGGKELRGERNNVLQLGSGTSARALVFKTRSPACGTARRHGDIQRWVIDRGS